jgi:putative membrane protein
VLVPLAAVSALYLRGAGGRRRAGRPRTVRTAAFLSGVLAVALAHAGPVPVAAQVLLWPHMVQHLLLVVVAAPLLAWGTPLATVRLALPPAPRHGLALAVRAARRLRRRLGDPHPLVLATVVHAATLWLWHAPVAYDAAVRNPGLHVLEHATFLLAAVWFWSQVWATARRAPREQALATFCLAGMILQGGVLGAWLSFAGSSSYAVYDGAAGWTALEDQQLAGVLMWVPPGAVYAPVALRRFVGWLRAAEHARRRRDTVGHPAHRP